MILLSKVPWTPPHEMEPAYGSMPMPFWNIREVRRLRFLAVRKARAMRRGQSFPNATPIVPRAPTSNGVQAFPRQCVNVNQITLERCRCYALRGQIICAYHGGLTPMAKFAAKQRLMEMCEPAFKVLNDCMNDELADHEVKIKAAIAVLDRAGFGPKATLNVKHKTEDLDKLSAAERLERGRRIMQELEARSADVIDATVEAESVSNVVPMQSRTA